MESNTERLIFPTPRHTGNYARLLTTLARDLSSYTLCLRVRTDMSYGSGMALVSYAVEEQNNELMVTGDGDGGFLLFADNQKATTAYLTVRDDLWHSLCVTWRGNNGSWQLYADGELRDSGSGLAVGGRINSGGTWILGQDQDTVGGGFETSQAFSGELSHVNLWDRVLSPSEIEAVWRTFCEHHGNVIDWTGTTVAIYGLVSKEQHRVCETWPS
ncbi:neuronal pentraxin-2-like [Branchiostoma floridae x Branchiostoma japonicum]